MTSQDDELGGSLGGAGVDDELTMETNVVGSITAEVVAFRVGAGTVLAVVAGTAVRMDDGERDVDSTTVCGADFNVDGVIPPEQ